MADGGAIPAWGHTGQGEEVAWDMVGLGGDYLPGQWGVEGLEPGVDIDMKKAKGADLPKSTDNGITFREFQLVGKLKAADWEPFCAVFPNFNPRRPGRERQPLPITHPATALAGIKNVRVLRVKLGRPTAKSGLDIEITVVEWSDAPKATKKANKPLTGGLPAPPAQIVGIDGVMEHFARRHGAQLDSNGQVVGFDGEKLPEPSDTDVVFDSMFGRPP
jgi:hypothetical protein